MSWAVDTNVLIRTTDVSDAAQTVAESALTVLRQSGQSLSIFPQNLIEFWVVATRPKINNGLSLTTAQTAIQIRKLKTLFTLLDDTPEVFSEWERIVSQYEVSGKQAHDARLVAAMSVHSLTHLLTFNTDDFERFSSIIAVNSHSINSDEAQSRD